MSVCVYKKEEKIVPSRYFSPRNNPSGDREVVVLGPVILSFTSYVLKNLLKLWTNVFT